jgi:flagellar secretion chaperone FliS
MTQTMRAYQVSQAYRGAAVTVSPLKAVVMLFDGAIMFLQKSVESYNAKRFEESHDHLVRATSILRGLSHHLIVNNPMGDRLFRTYNGLIMASHSSFGRPDAPQRYAKIIKGLTDLRDAWKYVAEIHGQGRKTSRA